MRVLLYALGVILIPLPAFQHFIRPLSNCILAAISNHTWIPECGVQNVSGVIDYKMFSDECDLYEYNCDHSTTYKVTNYTFCWRKTSAMFKMGDYRIVQEEIKWTHDPTSPTTNGARPVHLPAPMLYGKRIHTPEAKKRQCTFRYFSLTSPCRGCHTNGKITTRKRINRTFKRKSEKNYNTLKNTIPMARSSKATKVMTKNPEFGVVLKRLTVIKDGKLMVKVIKGAGTPTITDISNNFGGNYSDFLQ